MMRLFIRSIVVIAAIMLCPAQGTTADVPLFTDAAGNRFTLIENSSVVDLGNDVAYVAIRISLAERASWAIREELMLAAGNAGRFELVQGVSVIRMRLAIRLSVPEGRMTGVFFVGCDDGEINAAVKPSTHARWEYMRGDFLKIALRIKTILNIRRPYTYDSDYLRPQRPHIAGSAITYYVIPEKGARYCSTPEYQVINKPDFLSASQFFSLLSVTNPSLLASCSRGNRESCRLYERRHLPLKTLDAPSRCLYAGEPSGPKRAPRTHEASDGSAAALVKLLPWSEGYLR